MALIDDASDGIWSSLVVHPQAPALPAVTAPAVVSAAETDPASLETPFVAAPVALVADWIDSPADVEPIAEVAPELPVPVPVEPLGTVVPLLPVRSDETADPSVEPLSALPTPIVWQGAPPLEPVAPETVPDSVVVIAPFLDELAAETAVAEISPPEIAAPEIAAPEIVAPHTRAAELVELRPETAAPLAESGRVEVVLPVIVPIDDAPTPVAEPLTESTEPVSEPVTDWAEPASEPVTEWAQPDTGWAQPDTGWPAAEGPIEAVEIEMLAEAFTVEDQAVLEDFIEIQVIDEPLDTAPDDVDAVERVEAAVPLGGANLAAVRAMNPTSTAVQHQLEAVVMAGTETLTDKDRAMIALAVAIENRCGYWTHHLATVLAAWMPDTEVQAFVHDWNGTDLQLRERALLAFAVKLCLLPGQMTEQDARLLGSVGFTEADLLDIVDVVAYWGFATRVVDGLGVYLETVPAIESA